MGVFLGAYFTPNGSYVMQDAEDGNRTAQVESLERVRDEIDGFDPDALVVVSPHWLARRAFYVESGSRHVNVNDYPLLPQPFGRRYFSYEVDGDPELARGIVRSGRQQALPVEEKDYGIDHGAFTALRVMGNVRPVVLVSTSLRSYEECGRWGKALRAAVEESDRRVVVLCPGNLSHRLDMRVDTEGREYDPTLGRFDETALELVASGRYGRPDRDIPEDLFDAAQPETGLRTFSILSGLTGGLPGEVVSYVGFKFSVGDATLRFVPAVVGS